MEAAKRNDLKTMKYLGKSLNVNAKNVVGRKSSVVLVFLILRDTNKVSSRIAFGRNFPQRSSNVICNCKTAPQDSPSLRSSRQKQGSNSVPSAAQGQSGPKRQGEIKKKKRTTGYISKYNFVFWLWQYGMAPIHLAAWFGTLEILKLLVQAGAEQKVENEVKKIMMRFSDLQRTHTCS